MIKLKSFAKINLGLEVVNKREDGYHNLRTIFQTINLFDEIIIKEIKSANLVLNGSNSSIKWDETNTIYNIYCEVNKRFKINRGFDVFVNKNIPIQSGLGGGSSNAAVFLLFLNNYFKLNLSLKEMIDIARRVGADIPFFLVGGRAIAYGIGEELINLNYEPLKIGLVLSRINVPTSLVFSSNILTTTEIKSKINIFLRTGDYSVLKNNLEETTFRYFPELKKIKDKMLNIGFKTVLMTGSGSAFFTTGKLSELKKLYENFDNVLIVDSIDRNSYFKEIGAWPSGKASVFGADIRRFESSRPSNDIK